MNNLKASSHAWGHKALFRGKILYKYIATNKYVKAILAGTLTFRCVNLLTILRDKLELMIGGDVIVGDDAVRWQGARLEVL